MRHAMNATAIAAIQTLQGSPDQVFKKFTRSQDLLVTHAPAFAKFGNLQRPAAVYSQVFLAVSHQHQAFVIQSKFRLQ